MNRDNNLSFDMLNNLIYLVAHSGCLQIIVSIKLKFINILKGDMSLIGPRPERPYFVKELSQVLPFYETRHIIKPGLTGWAQVKTRYGSSVDDSLLKLQYDLYYIKHRSFFLDINILVKTLSTIIFYRGQ